MKRTAKSITYLLTTSIFLTGIQAVSVGAKIPVRSSSTYASPVAPPLPQADGQSLLSQARAQLRRGSADQALVSLNQALQAFTAANDAKGKAATHDALGDLYNRQGQYDVALAHYQEANTDYAAIPDTYNANLMLAKTGDMYFKQGKLTDARTAYARMSVTKPDTSAAGSVKATQQKASRVGGILGGVRSASSGNPTGAVAAANDVKNMVDQERNAYRQFIIYAIYELGQGRIDFASSQLDTAKTHFDNALAAADNPIYGKFGQSSRWRIASRTSLGDVAFGQARFPDAIKLYNAALDGAKKDKRADLLWPAQRGVGQSLLAQASKETDGGKAAKMRDDGIASYRAALGTIEALRSGSVGSDEARSTFLATTKDVYDETASALAERALLAAPGGAALAGPALADASEAFKFVEQSRARSLLDMLGESGSNLTEGVPADLLQKKQDNLARQQQIAEVLTGASLNADAQKKSTADLEKELEGLQVDFDNIENQIRTASPRYASLTKPQPLTLVETQQQVLDPGTVLLTYNLGPKDSYLWAVTNSAVSLYKLPARDIVDAQAFAIRGQLIPAKLRSPIAGINLPPTRGLGLTPATAGSPASEYAKAAFAIYSTAVAPAAAVIGDKRILVVADGALNYVPFEAMVTAGGGASYDTLPYLVQKNEIVYAPSASVLAVIRKQAAAKPTGKSMLIVADPVFNSNDPRAAGGTTTLAGGGDTRGLGLSSALTDIAGTPGATATGAPVQGLMLARLQGTRAEALQIEQTAKLSGATTETLLDLKANEEAVSTRDLKSYRVIHIATHGLLDAARPQFSGVVLSLVGNKTSDGFLRTDEIFNLKLGSPLVMLSACETGLGKEKRGEGVIGLTRAFMYAGAPTVGVSLWSVSDNSTAALMSDFYKRMLTGQGMPAASALRAAQIGMIAGKKYSAPFYWAPFVLVGEWH